MNTFTITEDHLKLLRSAYVEWCEDEYGAPAINPKRPYGNSFVEGDIAYLLGWAVHDEELSREQHEKAAEIHEQTQTALQIILSNLSDITGTYKEQSKYDSRIWKKVV